MDGRRVRGVLVVHAGPTVCRVPVMDGVAVVHGAPRPQSPCSLTGLQASSSLLAVPHGSIHAHTTAQSPTSAWHGAQQLHIQGWAAPRLCRSLPIPSSVCCPCSPLPAHKAPSTPLGWAAEGVRPILPPPCLAAGPRLPAPLHSAVMDRHAARQSLYSFHV